MITITYGTTILDLIEATILMMPRQQNESVEILMMWVVGKT